MASGLFVNPATLLNVVPVISSTCQLWFGWDQYEFLQLFLKRDIQAQSNQLLPSYFTTFFNRGAPRVGGLLLTTIVSSAANLRYAPGNLLHERGSFIWYSAAIGFALGHLTYFPFIFPHIRAITSDAKEKNVTELKNWLYVHNWRTLTVDLAGWVCCIVATVKTLSPVSANGN
ncbi:putative integral membrane protein [Hypoxylon trugodes]|uniref:putative integral membrane protein n=1 Tax=Hypoxylon trugodes TaxID=326681 RepID=UPI00219A3730|nr:putative integral membrane protein [Hypoxylon trugodes]KAI1392920.1 putative integral membrane protein [Hypoxylon trugodes]